LTEVKIHSLLDQFIPTPSVGYCLNLWKVRPFLFRVTRSRSTKAGDFFCASAHAVPRITVNNDLNPHLFLITYVHEVAHLRVFDSAERKADPHGSVWKQCFRELMMPLLTPDIFPEPLLGVLKEHMKNPKASSFADVALTRALRMHDHRASEMIAVSQLPEGSIFVLGARCFRKGKLRRTRYLCHEMKSKRQYLVPAEALVNSAQLSLGLFA
jgi:SprT protein